jgi:hypothetical protein
MQVKLTLENAWIETGNVRRVQTLNEWLEGQCEICLEKEGVAEVSVKDLGDEEDTFICCRECARLMVDALLADLNFVGNVKIIIL